MKQKKLFFAGSFFVLLVLSILLLYFLAPEKMVKTLFYFPNYNPFVNSATPETVTDIKNSQIVSTKVNESKLITVQIPINKAQKRKVIIYLPPNYDQNDTKTSYPFLILLHGSPGSETDWLEAGKAQESLDKAIATGNFVPAIVVFPDGNGGLDKDTQYINSTDNTELNADFITQTVVNFITQNFKIKPQNCFHAIGGLSSGGFGALNLGLKNQDIFGEIISFSGYGKIEISNETQKLIQHSNITIKNNSPINYIPDLKQNSVKIKLVVGKQDGFFDENKKLYELLTTKGFKVEFSSPNGLHSWVFWSAELSKSLPWLKEQWQ